MQNKPRFHTALPKRRLQIGEFTLILLGDIESSDGIAYRYILAVMQQGDPEPGIYLTCEPQPGNQYAMRLIMRDGAEILASSDDWNDADVFMEAALETVKKLLNLGDEQAFDLS